MRLFLKLDCFLFVLTLCCAANPQDSGTASATSFPTVVSYNLEKAKVTLPGDFQGETNLLTLSFEFEQQKEADSWTPVIKEVEASHPSFHHYFLPVFGRENFLYRWWMNSSLRSLLPTHEERQATIPLYLSRQAFLRQMQIPSDREITVLLVEKNGRVLWRTTGPLTEAKRSSLETALVASGKSEHHSNSTSGVSDSRSGAAFPISKMLFATLAMAL